MIIIIINSLITFVINNKTIIGNMMMMMTKNPEDIATEDLAIAKSSVAISSAHHPDGLPPRPHLLQPYNPQPPASSNFPLPIAILAQIIYVLTKSKEMFLGSRPVRSNLSIKMLG